MKLTKKEIYDHFIFGVEVEEFDGYRYWIKCEGYDAWMETADRIAKEGKLSDMDMMTKQTYPGMQEFYDGFFDWECDNRAFAANNPVNTYYDTVYAVEEDEPYIPCSTYGDYGPSNPWDAPGMKVSDFI